MDADVQIRSSEANRDGAARNLEGGIGDLGDTKFSREKKKRCGACGASWVLQIRKSILESVLRCGVAHKDVVCDICSAL
jgi:hypothetical protein